jgi:hypothetical protein
VLKSFIKQTINEQQWQGRFAINKKCSFKIEKTCTPGHSGKILQTSNFNKVYPLKSYQIVKKASFLDSRSKLRIKSSFITKIQNQKIDSLFR